MSTKVFQTHKDRITVLRAGLMPQAVYWFCAIAIIWVSICYVPIAIKQPSAILALIFLAPLGVYFLYKALKISTWKVVLSDDKLAWHQFFLTHSLAREDIKSIKCKIVSGGRGSLGYQFIIQQENEEKLLESGAVLTSLKYMRPLVTTANEWLGLKK